MSVKKTKAKELWGIDDSAFEVEISTEKLPTDPRHRWVALNDLNKRFETDPVLHGSPVYLVDQAGDRVKLTAGYLDYVGK